MTQAYTALKQNAQERERLLEAQPRIRVGTALCGLAAGAGGVADAFRKELTARGVKATVSEVGCLGLCYAEPLVDITLPGGPRIFYGNVTPDQVPELVLSHVVSGRPVAQRATAMLGGGSALSIPDLHDLPMMKGQVRVALRNAGNIDPTDIDQYIAAGGYAALDKALSEMTPQQVTEQVTVSGLRGRGGAAFPTGTKWRFIAGSPGPVKYILCNCEEGDPGAFNDKGILESDPHTLVEGMILAGYATGASNGIIFIRHGHEGPIERSREALRHAYEAGLLGKNILGSSFSFEAEVSLVGESYVSGEETALMEAVEGKRAMPRFRPPFPAAVGAWGKPSNINNIKTLAYVPEIIAKGGAWFAGIGTERSKGTAILCLSGSIRRPGMMEVPMGMTLRHALEEMAGGVPDGRRLKLLQTGGPLGGVLSADKLDVAMDFDAMARAGAILGSGGIIVADDTACAVDLTRLLVAFCQYESCGKCFPCRLGTTHMLEILERICRFQAQPGDIDLMRDIGRSMAVGSLCGHGQLGFNPVQSALNSFADEFAAHIQEKRCPAGVCTGEYLTPQHSRR
ncbi:MAG: NADH-ubiquinone oxidoreductase-F iron-sulfur binding region domain-containing protein [Dehalococcoidia bacterium]|nr:NADH-ubiquinone oxidoreductase-F iron-sulfur binding region domain-containing protein [Dehalococcoidia bacterium]